jgi:hypothetical protein
MSTPAATLRAAQQFAVLPTSSWDSISEYDRMVIAPSVVGVDGELTITQK